MKECGKQDCVSFNYAVSARCMECYNAAKYEPKPEEAQADEQISSVVGTSTASSMDFIILEEKDEHGHGNATRLEKWPKDDYAELEIDYDDHYNSRDARMYIDKDKAVKIINFLRKHFDI